MINSILKLNFKHRYKTMDYGIKAAKFALVEQANTFFEKYKDDFLRNITSGYGPQNLAWYRAIDFKLNFDKVRYCDLDGTKEFIEGLEYYWEQFILEYMWNELHGKSN